VFLREALDVKFSGLVGELYSKKVLSPDEKDDIIAEQTSCRANEKLLSVLSRKSPQQFQLFLDALDNCGQEHVRSVIDDRQGMSIHLFANRHSCYVKVRLAPYFTVLYMPMAKAVKNCKCRPDISKTA